MPDSFLLPLVSRLSIVDKKARLVPLAPNWMQTIAINQVEADLRANRPIRLIALKARQLGFSTITEAIIYVLSQVYHRSAGLVIANEQDNANHLLGITDNYWMTDPHRAFYTTKYQAKNVLAWNETHSSIKTTTAGNKDAGRSRTIRFLHASEVGFWDNAQTVMTGLMQAVPDFPRTLIALESTANGRGNYFHTMWGQAMRGENSYVPLFFPWWMHYEYRASYINLPPIPLGELDNEEKALLNLFDKGLRVGKLEFHLASKHWEDALVWRRWAIFDKAQGDIIKFHQEYPACVLAGTRVGTASGVRAVEDVVVGDLTTNGVVVAISEQPPTRCVRVTTAGGYRLECTWHHPLVDSTGLLIPAEASLDRVLQLASPKLPAINTSVEWSVGVTNTQVEITPDLARFMGYFAGDGYFNDGALSIVCTGTDPDVVQDVFSLMSMLGVEPRTRVVGTLGGGVEVRSEAKALIDTLTRLDMVRRRGSDSKIVRAVKVPESIWRSPRKVVMQFLSALFEADGFSNRAQWDVRLFTNYEQLARDVQLLLAVFDVKARVYGEGRGWVVGMTSDQALRFHDEVGFVGARKRANRPSRPPQTQRHDPMHVVSVEEIGEHASYDLSIEGRPYFDANAILTHNTPEEAFVATGTNVFPQAHLLGCFDERRGRRGRLMRRGAGVEFIPDLSGPLTLFKTPSANRELGHYVVGGDATATLRGDYAVAQVLNRRTFEQVAVWRGRIDPAHFGEELAKLGMYYNEALMAPENEGPGYATVGWLMNLDYPNMFQSTMADNLPGRFTGKYGWSSSYRSKDLAVSWLLRLLIERGTKVHDRKTFDEMDNYVTLDGGGYGPASGEDHDDTVMAYAIAVTASIQWGVLPAVGSVNTDMAGQMEEEREPVWATWEHTETGGDW